MLTHSKITMKLENILKQYQKLRFETVAEVATEVWETTERQRPQPGAPAPWRPIRRGETWGGSGVTGWFRGEAVVPAHADGRPLFVQARLTYGGPPSPIGNGEALLFARGRAVGSYNENHHFYLLDREARGGERIPLLIEGYAMHSYPSTQPFDEPIVVPEKCRPFDGIFLALEREEVSQFCFDLETLLKLVKVLEPNNLRRHAVLRVLERVWTLIPAMPAEESEADWTTALARARQEMAPALAQRNSPTVPEITLVAHSHIDTAWLWPIAETRRKCERTFASMANLLERFPEVIFLQSAPVHADFVREANPELFERIKGLVARGQWEPNGGCWVEPDCNITSGESLVRQFLVGIQWTRKHFGYSPDMLWQPDVFGYAAAIPQVLRGCGIRYFVTTKMAWNDTTRFPYDTFQWRGLDGSTVLSHLSSIPEFIDPEVVATRWHWAQHKDSESRRLAAYGWGDGGGGPTAESMEMARRVADLEGIPRTRHRTVSEFMRTLEQENPDWPEFSGELYLELHRGTTTTAARIKRGNRRTEIALRDAEFIHTLTALRGAPWPAARLEPLWKGLLLNQFHDILPGTSIAQVHTEAEADLQRLEAETRALAADGLAVLAGGGEASPAQALLLLNSLSWERGGAFVIAAPEDVVPALPGVAWQRLRNVYGESQLALAGLPLPSLGGAVLPMQSSTAAASGPSVFRLEGDVLDTPLLRVTFDDAGRIASLVLKAEGRDIVPAGARMNSLLCGEDVPHMWDRWDIDTDQELKLHVEARRTAREVVADGPLQFRLRQTYHVGRGSTLVQDVIFHAHSPHVDFETHIDWSERHRLLKVEFPIDVLADSARYEIQFGHAVRPTHRNYPQDRARFEVCLHKWMDVSDNGFGVALLNDCKYGVSVHRSTARLTLLKSGTHPDERGDDGLHRVTYSVLPHARPFGVEAVVRPAYELNVAPLVVPVAAGTKAPGPLLTLSARHVIVEAVKWAEEGRAFVVRLYEAGGESGSCRVRLGVPVSRVEETNLLEEPLAEAPKVVDGLVELFVRPFQIRTLKCWL